MVKRSIFRRILDFIRGSPEVKLQREKRKLERSAKRYNKLLEEKSENNKDVSSEKEKQIPDTEDESIKKISEEQTEKMQRISANEQIQHEEERMPNGIEPIGEEETIYDYDWKLKPEPIGDFSAEERDEESLEERVDRQGQEFMDKWWKGHKTHGSNIERVFSSPVPIPFQCSLTKYEPLNQVRVINSKSSIQLTDRELEAIRYNRTSYVSDQFFMDGVKASREEVIRELRETGRWER